MCQQIRDPTIISNLKFTHPYFGDHKLIEFTVNASKSKADPIKRRDWQNYTVILYCKGP